MEQQMTQDDKPKPSSGFSDKLGPIAPEHFSNDYDLDEPPVSKADLTPGQRRILASVLAANPSLSEEEALAQLMDAGL